ncbi:MAG: LacI family transcriptional regulator [Clostridiales bacterium]|nr:LacI family transcriptional regulator [Clostridiales bacterium]
MAKGGMTIYDIAEEAGVSASTVSRVLNGKISPSNKNRDIIERIVAKHNFRPNAMARSLSDTRTRTLGLMVADVRNPYYAKLVVECEKAANRNGYSIMVCNALNDAALEDANLDKFYEHRVDAIIQIGCRVDSLVSDPEYVAHVKRVCRAIPFIISGKLDGVDYYRVDIDHTDAMRQAVGYLVSLGHKDVALVGGSLSVKSTFDMYKQYIYQLGAAGLPFKDGFLQEGNYTVEGGYDCFMRLMALDRLPTAIIVVNDYSAAGVIEAAGERGFQVPQEMSVLSFDNTFLSNIVSPKLTSMDYDYLAFGEKLVEVAIGAIAGEKIPREYTIPPRLVVRDSCAPPSNAQAP